MIDFIDLDPEEPLPPVVIPLVYDDTLVVTSVQTNYKYNGSIEDGFYKMPILAGDTITFKVTISPSITQITAVPTVLSALLNRSYTVKLNII